MLTPKLWILAAVAVVIAAACGYATVQTLRLKAANESIERITAERDAAVSANGEFAAMAERAANAARKHLAQIEQLRAHYERRLANVRKIPDDGCLDRALPADVLSLLRAGDSGAGDTYCPAGP